MAGAVSGRDPTHEGDAMIAQHTGQQPRHRVLPVLTIGLAVLGLIVTTSVVWLVQRQQQEEISRQREKIARLKQAACLRDEVCRRTLAQWDEKGQKGRLAEMVKVRQQEWAACLRDEACRQEVEKSRVALGGESPTGVDAPPVKQAERWDMKIIKFIGAAAVTLPVLSCALYVIVSPTYGDADKKWAYGAVGTLLGSWLGAT
jgi:hypothetical protein